jgi:hypothetical protein
LVNSHAESSAARTPADRPFAWWEWAGVLLLLAGLTWFGRHTLDRSALWAELQPDGRYKGRMTDFGVYARAGWAVFAGEDPYAVADDNDWHFVYPPPAAILFVPFADPPAGHDRTGFSPYALGVAVWYAVSVLLMAVAAHLFAGAVLPDARRWSRRWWYARLLPFDLCLTGIGHTLGRGQVNILLLALLAGMFVAATRRRQAAAGFWLATAAALKVIPAVMGLFFLARREWRAAAASLVGAAVLFLGVPSLVWGPGGAVEMNRRMIDAVLLPGLANEGDTTRAEELTNHTATDSQSFQAVIHNWRHPHRDTRPAVADPQAKLVHWVIVLAMLLTTAWAGFRAPRDAPTQLVVFGCIGIVMMLATPVSHTHYYILAFPLIAGLIARDLAARPWAALPRLTVLLPLTAWAIATTLPLVPGPLCLAFRDFGLGTAATAALWGWGIAVAVRGK